MSSRIGQSLALITLLVATTAQAGVFKCKVDGKITFSDTPCAPASEKIDVKYSKYNATEAAAAHDRYERTTAKQAAAARARATGEAIRAKQEEIAGLERLRDTELERLRAKKALANNNLAGAAYEQSISTEMQAVVAKYNGEIQAAREDLQQLQQQH